MTDQLDIIRHQATHTYQGHNYYDGTGCAKGDIVYLLAIIERQEELAAAQALLFHAMATLREIAEAESLRGLCYGHSSLWQSAERCTWAQHDLVCHLRTELAHYKHRAFTYTRQS